MADLFLHHLPECFAAASDRGEKNDHIVNAAAERCADQDPERAGQKTKLRCQHRADQRSRTGDCRKMMPENHPTISRDVISAVVMQHSWGSPLVIEHEYFCCQPFAIETVANGSCAKPRHNNPERADLFALRKTKHTNRHHTEQRHGAPEQFFPKTHPEWNLVEVLAPRHNVRCICVCGSVTKLKNS